jgi:hypothetical protein
VEKASPKQMKIQSLDKRPHFLFRVLLFVVFVFLGGSTAFTKGKENIIDFEADVIEGDRQRPDLFLEIKGEDLDIESILYLRENFNDFFENSKPDSYYFIDKK